MHPQLAEDEITDIGEYVRTICSTTGASTASLLVAYILLERFLTFVFFEFDEVGARLLLRSIFSGAEDQLPFCYAPSLSVMRPARASPAAADELRTHRSCCNMPRSLDELQPPAAAAATGRSC